ncbi:MAG: Crp/Fnr family transcriptional regulator [Ignavibacteriales bacterium]|nr:Crp/Fnr family transcriptional regulator [Ignavibacteriales bacterium]
MFDLLRAHIERRVSLTEEGFRRCTSYFTHKRIRKRQFLLQEGEICRHIAFVTAGCLRAYTVDHKGGEHVIQFAVADWWISDLSSYLTGAPATYTIDALQDSEVLLLERTARDTLLETVPAMERFFRLLQEANYIATHRRLSDSLSASAEERYVTFLKTYPNLAEQISQGHIASYLGITPQSLSRIRREMTRKR